MGFYTRRIFPRLCDLLLGRPIVARHRKELLAQAAGNVLEIGFGTGLNLPYYPASVHRITALDPNSGMHSLAQRRIKNTVIEVEQRLLRGEKLPFPDQSFDCVVSTFTLCSIDDVNEALSEVYRVLKPGGRFLFLEHGRSPDAGVEKWQRRLNPLERWLADGCRLDRDIRSLVAAHPFHSVQVKEFDLERTPRTHGHLYQGVATR